MGAETDPNTTPAAEQPAADASASGAAAPPTPAPAVETGRTPKVITVPTNEMSRIRAKEREKGRKAALDELNAEAKTMGYPDFAALKAAAARRTQAASARRPGATPQPVRRPPVDDDADAPLGDDDDAPPPAAARPAGKPAAPEHPRLMSRLQRENQRLLEEKKRLNRARALSDRRVLELERQTKVKEAENQLRLAAFRAGIQSDDDIDYALDLLRREHRGKTEKQLAGFDENTFFTSLRERRPYMFAEVARPVGSPSREGTPGNGGTSGGAPPAPPKPGSTVARATANSLVKNALDMTPAEFEAHLTEQGLNRPSGSYRA